MAMQEQSPITQLPQEIIRHITSLLDEQGDCKALRSSCRYLHASVTRENKKIIMRCSKKRGSLSEKEFLDKVFLCIQHIVARKGNSTIDIWLELNHLNDDMNALAQFLAKCAHSSASEYITELGLEYNDLPFLPHEIGGITGIYPSQKREVVYY